MHTKTSHQDYIYKQNLPMHYSFAPVVMSFRRICRVDTSLSSAGFGPVAFSNNCRPTTSDMAMTREDTVAPSRRFLLFLVSIEVK